MHSIRSLCSAVRLISATVTLTISAFASQQLTQQPDLQVIGADSEAIAEMDALLQSFVDDGRLNCVSALVAKEGNVVYHKAFGWKDLENKIPARPDDYYVLFSQTKAITSVAFMLLVEQGRVSIDDPVSMYFPGIPNTVVTKVHEDGSYETRPAAQPMTFVHLLSHTSGLGAGLVREIRAAQGAPSGAPAGFGGPIPENPPAGQRTGGGNPESQTLEEEMLALAEYPLGFDPGERWEYHVSTNMLGYLIERISGQPLRDFVKEHILLPLGMEETDWYYEPEQLSRFVKPYRLEDGELKAATTLYSEATIRTPHSYAEGAIGLNGPIEDYAKFCQMLLNEGTYNGVRILKPETVRAMTRINRLPVDAENDNGFRFGLGFELHTHQKPVPAVSDLAFAWGGMFGTAYLIDPGHDLIALFYVNMIDQEALYPSFLEQAYQLVPTVQSPAPDNASSNPANVMIEDGGSGAYSAVATEREALPGMTLFQPANLDVFESNLTLPVLLWGNGACANTTQEHKNFLSEIASHGYLLLAIGRLDQIHERDERSREPTHSGQLLEALDWILQQNRDPQSEYYGKIDTHHIAAMGMSCGGLQAIEISGDPRISTTIVCNSGVLPTPSPMPLMPSLDKDALLHFHGPVLYLMGGPSDIAYGNAMDDFARVNHVPIAMANLDVGHGGTYHEPHGGAYSPVALAWLDWHLKGQSSASQWFLDESKLREQDAGWTLETKGF